ncbi:MAG: DUF1385 domain-containing protein [Oscillospiraceae bacterium]|nr:DUF1385 domain-containing protein [Oscillospiraceae bacterium]
MGIGGSSRNDGVNFLSDNYTATFIMDKDNNYKIKTSKNIVKSSKFSDFMCKIPFIKSLYKLFSSDRIVVITIAILVLLDILSIGERRVSHSSIVMRIAYAVILLTLLGTMIYVIKKILIRAKRTRSFHGAEHKVIHAYDKKMELTLENVRGCPRIAKRCGTNLVVFLLPIYFILEFVISYSSLQFIISFMLAYEIFDMKKGHELPIIKLFYKFGYFCQEKLFTTEPDDAQLLAAIATMERLLELENRNIYSQKAIEHI